MMQVDMEKIAALYVQAATNDNLRVAEMAEAVLSASAGVEAAVAKLGAVEAAVARAEAAMAR